MALRPAIFLDKDGTVLEDVPYNIDPHRMRFAPGARQGLARLGELHLPLIVISNQPGVALGKFRARDIGPMRNQLKDMFRQVGATLDGFYYCPHHPDGIEPRFAIACDCRKPAPGLLRMAARRHNIDLGRSWFIGDILDDVEAGNLAGCNTVLLNNGHETEWLCSPSRQPNRIDADLEAASRWIAAQFAEHHSEVTV
ncbi:HAD family hydrolase [Candidimonas sp. SYP-B2681]|uniref:D-glycero-alpha-D-manno-heptose-1,7-bisphosphate 7-phosphatase n=1 Tax=Candidimonas sp. SYP-B2681 TaxID=2497686 RepID=UPI000F8659FE|nr:HAD family hydrolase [Candidimonas sp. SYP-B2681]RTZ48143.1 HAD family hydrolase [Candidimonas sp. SYP-B2681]